MHRNKERIRAQPKLEGSCGKEELTDISIEG